MSKIVSSEKLLAENPNRFVMFPLEDQSIWDAYKRQMDSFWRVEEVDLSKDMSHWKTLTKDEQHFIKYIFGIFLVK